MKIALVNSFYSRSKPSGENEIFEQLQIGLCDIGIRVSPITVETDVEALRYFYRLRSAVNIAIGRGARNPAKKLKTVQPDLIHVNNLFPNFQSSWIKKTDVPKVITLHNFRPICAAGTFSRDGKFCDLCLKKPFSAVRYGCYRNSRIATFPFYISRLFRTQERYIAKFQRVLVPSKRALALYSAFGITSTDWQVIPHSIDSSKYIDGPKTEKFVFIGRLTAEKGIEKLLDMWPSGYLLDVIGDGELDRSRYLLRSEINFLGRIPRKDIMKMASGYKALIFSSSSPESAFPLVALECLAFGVPIISVDQNTVADAIREGKFGVVLPVDYKESDLVSGLEFVSKNYDCLNESALKYSEDNHNYDSWILKYESLYREVIKECKLAMGLEK